MRVLLILLMLVGVAYGEQVTRTNGNFVNGTPADADQVDANFAEDLVGINDNADDIDALQAASHAESHSVASHSDTTATGPETETLTDGSNADSLHIHTSAGDDVQVQSLTFGNGSATVVHTYDTNSTDPTVTVDNTGKIAFSDDVGIAGDLTLTGGLTQADKTTEPGNLMSIFDNDTAFANDPTCANSGVAGMLTFIDKDETASDTWVVCDGTSELADLGAASGIAGAPLPECFPLYAPTAEIQDTYDIESVWRASAALTITEVWCETDIGTVTMDIQIDDGTPADVMGVDLVCAATAVSDSTGLTGGMAAGNTLDFAITSVATAPKRLSLCIGYDYD